MAFANTRKMVVFAVMVALGALQSAVDAAGDKWHIKDMFDDTLTNITNYAFVADTVSYTTEADFEKDGEMIKTIKLTPGQSLKYACGSAAGGSSGTFTMFPNDPIHHVLGFKGDHDIDVALKRIRPAYSVYRSDSKLVNGTFQRIGLDHLLIAYNADSIIAAHDPENFSINLVCMFQPHDKNVHPRYRWLQIQFETVVALPYGCGTGEFHMFKNAIPVTSPVYLRNDTKAQRFCTINAEPGMVVGIYCKPGERVYPDDCFVQTQALATGNIARSALLETNFPHNSLSGRLRLARVRNDIEGYNTGSVCFCKDRYNTITASVKVLFNAEQICDYEKFMSAFLRHRTPPRYQCHKELRPGSLVKVIVPKSGKYMDTSKLIGPRGVYPRDPTVSTFVNSQTVSGFTTMKIGHLVASMGLQMTQTEDSKNDIYEFKASKDAILILMTPVANLTFVYEYFDTFMNSLAPHKTLVSIGIVPTDPYTHGCGVAGSSILFNDEGVTSLNGHMRTDSEVINEMNCTVNGYVTSPVGFYCPSNHDIYPPDCFTSAVLLSTGKTVLVKDYAPTARVVESKHLRVLDFLHRVPEGEIIKYSNEKLRCYCKRKDGKVLATITLDLSRVTPRA